MADNVHIVILVRASGVVERTEISGFHGEDTADQMVYDAKTHAPDGRYLFGVHIVNWGNGETYTRGRFNNE